jgi:hypothetical protein
MKEPVLCELSSGMGKSMNTIKSLLLSGGNSKEPNLLEDTSIPHSIIIRTKGVLKHNMAITNETHGFWRFFYHSIQLKLDSKILHLHPTHEIDEPYRWSKSLILRLPRTTRGLVLGWWRNITRTEEEAILAGMQGREMTYLELVEEQSDYDEVFESQDSIRE